MKWYDDSGKPKTNDFNKFAFPPEISKKIGPIG